MPTLRNRRLEQLLGGAIDETLTYAQVKGLIPDTTEGPDLDFKRDTYSGDRGRKALSGDVAALANASGGILVLGIDEDDQGRAAADTGVAIGDDERRRLRQTVVANVQPTPTFDIIPVENPERPGTGFLVIWVARSATAPHAYIAQNKAMLYPRRIGTETVWLSEGEVAEAYRARFAGFANRVEETAQIEADFVQRLAPDEVFAVVTLVPDLPGSAPIDSAALHAFQLRNATREVGAFGIRLGTFHRSTVRRRCLVGTGSMKPSQPHSRLACELHESGSGVFGGAKMESRPEVEDGACKLVDNQWLTVTIGTGLNVLARHARDQAAAGGLATVRATIWPATSQVPVALVANVGWHNEPVGRELVSEPPVAEAVADIDDLSAGGAGLVATTYRLASELFQGFGAAEAEGVTPEGAIRLPCWHLSWRDELSRWARSAGVEVLPGTPA
ncbi:AlbA family DNA-binding domain-containing protein [Plantactinospora sp. CA-294935]|uniref:AlbA family DNA-binding domain-containing protein n=1 Tax=Plantactinospora sp. CA-294935 TaxID=3240012 RepID=UPI003D8DB034